MLRLFIGIAALLLGVGMFVFGLYYGWASGLPSADTEARNWYQSQSTVFGVLTFGLLGIGGALIFVAIRKMNARYREEQTRSAARSSTDR
jgi:hypothetical protein